LSLWPPKNRSHEYRERAAEARVKAEDMTDPDARKTMMDAADMWERMADYEQEHGPAGSN
jgi:hypothetical protein